MTDFIKPRKPANSWSISVSYPFTLDSQSILSPDLLNPKICFEVDMKSKLIPFTFFLLPYCNSDTNLISLSYNVTIYLIAVSYIYIYINFVPQCDYMLYYHNY